MDGRPYNDRLLKISFFTIKDGFNPKEYRAKAVLISRVWLASED